MIELIDVNKIYNVGKENEFQALKNVSLVIEKKEMVAIMGKSGAGKSTLMHIIGCIDNFETGKFLLKGNDVSKINENQKAKIRNKEIGIVMQDFALVEDYTAIENVMIPLYFDKRCSLKTKRNRAIEMLKQLEIEELADKKVNKLSGGQKQRVAIARALINEPDIILADEPTGALDAKTSYEVISVFRKLNEQGKTVIIITHDIEVANACDRIVEIADGSVVRK